jgi:hypothetical protein
MIVLLRGHIRQSFETADLYYFLKELYDITHFELYIHTWSIKQSSLSWRPMNEDLTPITKEIIYEYLKDLSRTVKLCIIDDEKLCSIIGRTEGYVCSSIMPILGWKRYWYGQYHILDEMASLPINKKETILNFRFDVLGNTFCSKKEEYLAFAKEKYSSNFTKNIFLKDSCFWGLDNFYIGNYETMYKAVKEFHLNLDEIEGNYKECKSQEFLFFYHTSHLS